MVSLEDTKEESETGAVPQENVEEAKEVFLGEGEEKVETEEKRSEALNEEGTEEQDGEEDGPPVGTDPFEKDAKSLPPTVTSAETTLVDGVTKQVMKEGRGIDTPSRHSTCFLHYRAWAVGSMHKFEDTWGEGVPCELIVGHEKKQMRGLGIAVASMTAGERALFGVGYNLAYGEEGNFSFPNVAPKSDVIYEVELIGFEEAKEGRPRGEMTVEERIASADRRRVDGNELFKEDKLQEAMQQYEMALAYFGDDFMFQLYGKYKDMADSVKIPCHLNMAACLLKREKYEEAIGHCTVVLAENKNNTKALFRRGKARSALGQTDAAKQDFEALKKLEPGDKAVVRELRKIAEDDRQLYLKQKELYKGLFPKAPPPKKDPWYLVVYTWIMSLFRYFLSLFQAKSLKTKSN